MGVVDAAQDALGLLLRVSFVECDVAGLQGGEDFGGCLTGQIGKHDFEREGKPAASHTALSKQAHAAARQRTAGERSAAAEKAARTKGPEKRHAAAMKAVRTKGHEGLSRAAKKAATSDSLRRLTILATLSISMASRTRRRSSRVGLRYCRYRAMVSMLASAWGSVTISPPPGPRRIRAIE